jgi:ribosomal protein S18 acetylase RimI-like enzyme
VRRASAADIPALTEMLARAFEDDPVSEWASPPPGPRMRMLERFHGARLRHFLPHGEVWMTLGGEAAALWAPPGEWHSSPRENLELTRGMLTPSLLTRAPRVARGLLGVEKAHPAEPPHWYLSTLGTNPAAQGRGFGTAVLMPVLEQCDRDGVAAYLESSKRANVDYYARFGFRVTETLRLPSGPEVWLMWREPRDA